MTDIAANSEAEVVEAVRAAREWKSPLNIVGAGTKRNLGRAVASWGTVFDLSGLTGIVAYEPEELILTVKPGTPVAEIVALLATKNQRLGFDPADWGPMLGAKPNSATIGGVMAADACGAGAVRYGRARDHLLGFRAVNGLGETYKAGGKVVKNVTGFDLPKLMCGAFGALGPLTELTLRVVPKAPLSVTLAILDVAPVEGLSLLRRAWSSPLETTGLAYIPSFTGKAFPEAGDIGKGVTLIRLEGAAEPLKDKKVALHALLGKRDLHDIADGDALFRKIGDGVAFTDVDIWRVVVPPASAAPRISKMSPKFWLADWAGGVLWIGVDANDNAAGERMQNLPHAETVTQRLMRASAETRARVPVFQPLSADMLALTRSVKAAFDPLRLFNPGRMYEGV